MFKLFFKDQINKNSENYLLEILNNELGAWPLLTNNENSLSTLELMKRIHKFKLSSILSFNLINNPKNPDFKTINVIKFLYF